MAKQRFIPATEIAADPEAAKLLLARAEALLAIEEQAAILKASKADLFDDMRDDRLDPALAKAFVAEKLRDPEKEERARLAAEDRRIVLDALEMAESRKGRARARAIAPTVPKNTEMDRETGPGNADGCLAAESDPAGERGNPKPEASHAGPGESPGAISPEAASALPRREDGAAAQEARHEVADDAHGAGEGKRLPIDPAPVQPPSPAPRVPLAEGGHTWRNLVEAFGWTEDRVQELWLAGTPATQRFEPAEAA